MSTTKTRGTFPKILRTQPKVPTAAGHHVRPDSGEAFLRDPTEADPRMHSSDPLAEMLGEEFVQAATSGEEAYSDDVEAVTTEELGGPFIEGVVSDEPAGWRHSLEQRDAAKSGTSADDAVARPVCRVPSASSGSST